MLVKIGQKFEVWIRKALPDPLVIAIILTLIVGLLALALTPTTPIQVVENWSKGFWELISFTMQVAFGLIAGACLAQSPAVKRGMTRLCSIPKSAAGAVLMLSVTTLVLWFVNWGIGLIAGAFLAKETAVQLSRKGAPYHLPLLAAGGYSGIITYEMGLTGAVPLWIAAAGHTFEADMGVVPLGEMVFSSFDLLCFAGMLVLVPLCLILMSPKDRGKLIMLDPAQVEEEENRQEAGRTVRRRDTFAEKVENMRLWSWFIALLGLAFAVNHFVKNGFNVDLNIFNLIILCIGLAVWGYPLDYAASFKEQTSQAWGVILQFPFYAGIMGIMTHSGLVPLIAKAFVQIASPRTMAAISFLSAGIVNFFVPSGGGQWAVQGPVMIEAAKILGVELKTVPNAIGYGDAWTNLASPFWALPMAGVLGIKVRDFLGYSIVVTLVTGLFLGGMFLLTA